MIPPIHISLLPSTCSVRVPVDGERGGCYAEPVEIANVRFDRSAELLNGRVARTDGAKGILFVDAVNSDGAFEIPEGSLVSIDGRPYALALKTSAYEEHAGVVHHWEVEVA